MATDTPLGRAIRQVAERIEGVLDEERLLLASGGHPDLDALVARKSHLALELSRLIRHAESQGAQAVVREILDRLSAQLARNAQLLNRHIEAVREVSSIIASAINSSTDDGTYSRAVSRPGAMSW